MMLQQLLNRLVDDAVLPDQEVLGLSSDSRVIKPGDLFCNVALNASDSERFIQGAIDNGAVAVVTSIGLGLDSAAPVPILEVADIGHVLATVSARFYHHPSDHMQVIGVTGTNGKTTVAYLLAQLFTQLDQPCAYIGTLGVGCAQKLNETGFTTPPADVFQKNLRDIVDRSIHYAAVEVSSHALAQKRIDCTHVSTALFTNLSQDHLDYHGSMEAYGAAKQRLFSFTGLQHAVINIDDAFGCKLLSELGSAVTGFSISLNDSRADLFLTDLRYELSGIQATLVFGDQTAEFTSRLVGGFNFYNILSVVATGLLHGFSLEALAQQVNNLEPPPGRMEFVQSAAPMVVVDYAHTPDALASACINLRQHLPLGGQLIVAFGCGGDRDADKRAKMGAIADRDADLVVLTSDNPRSESPEQILDDILQGLSIGKPVLVELDRGEAIKRAIARASAKDIVLIAGKGHENYQIIGNQRLDFSDVDHAKLVLNEVSA